jgi:hypothetical protein
MAYAFSQKSLQRSLYILHDMRHPPRSPATLTSLRVSFKPLKFPRDYVDWCHGFNKQIYLLKLALCNQRKKMLHKARRSSKDMRTRRSLILILSCYTLVLISYFWASLNASFHVASAALDPQPPRVSLAGGAPLQGYSCLKLSLGVPFPEPSPGDIVSAGV